MHPKRIMIHPVNLTEGDILTFGTQGTDTVAFAFMTADRQHVYVDFVSGRRKMYDPNVMVFALRREFRCAMCNVPLANCTYYGGCCVDCSHPELED